jgi:hypothetical protein
VAVRECRPWRCSWRRCCWSWRRAAARTGGAQRGGAAGDERDAGILRALDNSYPIGRVQPGATTEFTDDKLETYRYVKAESTQAIFRTYSMEQVRQDGYTLVVRPAIDDHPCVEKP